MHSRESALFMSGLISRIRCSNNTEALVWLELHGLLRSSLQRHCYNHSNDYTDLIMGDRTGTACSLSPVWHLPGLQLRLGGV